MWVLSVMFGNYCTSIYILKIQVKSSTFDKESLKAPLDLYVQRAYGGGGGGSEMIREHEMYSVFYSFLRQEERIKSRMDVISMFIYLFVD